MNTHTKSAKGILAPIFLGIFLFPFCAFASNIDISPRVIDMKGRAREISHHGITLKNKTNALLSTFVWAVDVDQAKGDLGKSDMSGDNSANQATSPSRWLEISRNISVLPNEEQSVPLQIQIPSQTKPGIYHVSLKFSTGANQNEAMSCESCTTDVVLNIEVTEDIREKLQLYSFAAVKNVFIKPEAQFKFSVENTGNKTVVPNGKIRIFDNSGTEVGLIDVNLEGKQIEPKAKDLLAATWMAKGKFGKYKALLDVSYGQRGSMQDVVYFWVIPWFRLFGFIITISAVMVITMLFVRSRSMAKPRYSYSNIEEEEYEEPVQYNKPKVVTSAPLKLDSNTYNRQRQNGLTEINIPSRTRTVPPSMAVSISEKKKPVGAEHIVRLK